jgi:hypothetical protein
MPTTPALSSVDNSFADIAGSTTAMPRSRPLAALMLSTR